MIKKISILVLAITSFFIFLPNALAQTQSEESFEARVTKILAESKFTLPDSSQKVQQNLQLDGLEGEWRDREIIISGISDIQVLGGNVYNIGDNVIVNRVLVEGEEKFYIVDYVRRASLYWAAALFAFVIIVVGRKRGLKALLGLVLSFFIILKFILPQILNGSNPVVVSLMGALAILVVVIYLTEGIKKKSHLAVLSVFLSLSITLVLSWFFTNMARLTGMVGDEVMYLIGNSELQIDFRGLLLAGIIIGVVGVLDDVIIGQIESVEQIKKANPDLPSGKIFTLAYKIGNAHLGAIVNTLFLTYAGASLPLLLLFTMGQGEAVTFLQAINNELVATEVIRTFVGSIGVALSLPISTYLAAQFLNIKKQNLS